MNERVRELLNQFRPYTPATVQRALGMHLEIVQALDLDGAEVADYNEWHDQGNTVRRYVNRTLYKSSSAEVRP